MKPETARCDECPLNGRPFVPGHGKPGGLAVVGEAPGVNEARQGQPFVGLSGSLLRQTLEGSGIDPDEVYITNSCLCHPAKNETPTNDAIDACRKRLWEELASVKPRKILTVGGVALQAMLPDQPMSITKARGRWYWVEEVGCYALPTYHPAALLRDPTRFPDFASDIALLARMPTEKQEPLPTIEYTLVETPAQLRQMVKRIYELDAPHVALDLETTGIDEFFDPIVCIGLAASPDDIWVVNHHALANQFVVDNLRLLLEDPNIVWAGQNANQFDAKFLRQQLNIDCVFKSDTLLAHYTLDERQSGHDLKTLSRLYFQADSYADEIREVGFERFLSLFPDRAAAYAEKYRDANPPTAMTEAGRERQVVKREAFLAELLAPVQRHELQTLWQYQAEDCHYTWRLVNALAEQMDEEEVSHIHSQILVPASRALGIVEQTGVRIDIPYLRQLDEQFTQDAARLLEKFKNDYSLDDAFNPNSPVQVKALLIDNLKLLRKGSSTDAETLATIKHPAAEGILELRQKTKVQGTYIRGLLERVYPDERIRASFNINGTRTGRLSSSDPNLQNIPKLMGPVIRKAFIPTEGWQMFEADYSQLELRIAAHYSGDPKLVQVYLDDGDIHTLVASEVFNVPYDEVTFEQRYVAKYIDFGILYGRQAPSLAYGELHCSVKQAQQYIDNFLGRFPHLRLWMTDIAARALRDGYVRSAMGRKRRFPLILENNSGDIQRQAVNTPIQSLASDLCLTALTRIVNRLDRRRGRVLLTVHDSILCEACPEYFEEAAHIVKYEMEDNCPMESQVPFKVEIETGVGSWGDLKESWPPKD